MAESPPRPPALAIDQIQKNANDVREAAALLTNRIAHFEAYLGSVPGRIETIYYGDHPDSRQEDQGLFSLVLKLHRQGQEWWLSYAVYHEAHDDPMGPTDFKRLADAPLKLKIAAIRMFPDFLEAVIKAQDKLVTDILKVTGEYDKFAQAFVSKVEPAAPKIEPAVPKEVSRMFDGKKWVPKGGK